jgi:hypothetical protein
MKYSAVVTLLTLSAVGCALDDADARAEAGAGPDTGPEASVDAFLLADWVSTTTSGIEVTVRPDRVPDELETERKA